MQDNTLNITVIIAGRPYKMSVAREQEELIRKATNQVNKAIKDYAHSFEFKDQQDLLAMVALQSTVGSIQLENEKGFREREMEIKLTEIDEVLSGQLASE